MKRQLRLLVVGLVVGLVVVPGALVATSAGAPVGSRQPRVQESLPG